MKRNRKKAKSIYDKMVPESIGGDMETDLMSKSVTGNAETEPDSMTGGNQECAFISKDTENDSINDDFTNMSAATPLEPTSKDCKPEELLMGEKKNSGKISNTNMVNA